MDLGISDPRCMVCPVSPGMLFLNSYSSECCRCSPDAGGRSKGQQLAGQGVSSKVSLPLLNNGVSRAGTVHHNYSLYETSR